MGTSVKPYNSANSKKEEVAEMFDNISNNYDFLNHFLSAGIDIMWRKRAIRLLKAGQPKCMLDIATGTGDFAIEASKLNPEKITGVDISEGMLAVGREKMKKKGYDDRIEMLYGDSEDLPFEADSYDAITVAFGVRNFENLPKGLAEMQRVLKPGGQVAIIEFSKPQKAGIKQLYNFYSNKVLPRIGKMVSKDARAYTYLPESVKAFPDGEDFLTEMRNVGFTELKAVPLTFGIATIYLGSK